MMNSGFVALTRGYFVSIASAKTDPDRLE